jgi:hypothetical protein
MNCKSQQLNGKTAGEELQQISVGSSLLGMKREKVQKAGYFEEEVRTEKDLYCRCRFFTAWHSMLRVIKLE